MEYITIKVKSIILIIHILSAWAIELENHMITQATIPLPLAETISLFKKEDNTKTETEIVHLKLTEDSIGFIILLDERTSMSSTIGFEKSSFGVGCSSKVTIGFSKFYKNYDELKEGLPFMPSKDKMKFKLGMSHPISFTVVDVGLVELEVHLMTNMKKEIYSTTELTVHWDFPPTATTTTIIEMSTKTISSIQNTFKAHDLDPLILIPLAIAGGISLGVAPPLFTAIAVPLLVTSSAIYASEKPSKIQEPIMEEPKLLTYSDDVIEPSETDKITSTSVTIDSQITEHIMKQYFDIAKDYHPDYKGIPDIKFTIEQPKSVYQEFKEVFKDRPELHKQMENIIRESHSFADVVRNTGFLGMSLGASFSLFNKGLITFMHPMGIWFLAVGSVFAIVGHLLKVQYKSTTQYFGYYGQTFTCHQSANRPAIGAWRRNLQICSENFCGGKIRVSGFNPIDWIKHEIDYIANHFGLIPTNMTPIMFYWDGIIAEDGRITMKMNFTE